MNKPDIQERLRLLRQEYAAKLPARVDAMITGWRALEQDWNSDRLENLYRGAHTLLGTAANFGFSQLGDCAGELDHLLGKLRDQTPFQSPTREQKVQIEQCLRQLQGYAAADSAPPSNLEVGNQAL